MLYDEKQLYNEGFNQNQVEEIIDGQMAGVDVSSYDKKSFLAIQMRQVRLGLISGLDVSEYAHDFYDWFQMEEIREGLEAGVDVEKYAAPSVPYDVMRELKEALIEGIDLSRCRKQNAKVLHLLRGAVRRGYELSEFLDVYGAPELEEICAALDDGLDIRPYLRADMCANVIHEIVCGLRDQLDVRMYTDERLNWRQMREIRLGLMHRVDAGAYNDTLYTWRQMREIRLGLEDGLDISQYCSFLYIDADMRRIRQKMLHALLDAEGELTDTGLRRGFGAFSIVLEESGLSAYLLLGEELPKAGEVREALQQLGIEYGIREDVLDALASGKRPETNVIAQGVRPTRGADGWYEYLFDTDWNTEYTPDGDGMADYTALRWFEQVEKGQKLAVYHEAQCGQEGRTVTGIVIPGLMGKQESVLTGAGLTLLEDQRTYAAAIDGKAELDSGGLRVTKLLVIERLSLLDVKVVFDGTVYVRGDVESGTTIRAASIIVDGLVGNAQIESQGDVLLRGGVRGAESIHAKGSVAARFFENARVVAGGSIQANYSENSTLCAGGRIVMTGSKGYAAGGTLSAQLGITVQAAGDSEQTPTVLQCVLLESVLEASRRLEEERASVGREIEMLANAQADYDQHYPPQVRNAMELYIKIEYAVYLKKRQMQQLIERRAEIWRLKENVNQSRIMVNDRIYPSVQVRIGTGEWHSQEREHIVISKDGGALMVEAL